MNKPQTAISPEEIFNDAIAESGPSLTAGELRLLTSGLSLLRSAQEKKLNEIELRAISGMIAYVAYMQNVNEDTVSHILTTKFNVQKVQEMPSRCFLNALEFLVDLEMNKAVN